MKALGYDRRRPRTDAGAAYRRSPILATPGEKLPAPRCEIRSSRCRTIGASAIKCVEILRPTPPGPMPVLPTQHAIDNPAHLMAKWMWLSNLLQSGILTTNEIRDLDRRLSGHHQNC